MAVHARDHLALPDAFGMENTTCTVSAYTALLFVSGMADKVLKPLMLGRGADIPPAV